MFSTRFHSHRTFTILTTRIFWKCRCYKFLIHPNWQQKRRISKRQCLAVVARANLIFLHKTNCQYKASAHTRYCACGHREQPPCGHWAPAGQIECLDACAPLTTIHPMARTQSAAPHGTSVRLTQIFTVKEQPYERNVRLECSMSNCTTHTAVQVLGRLTVLFRFHSVMVANSIWVVWAHREFAVQRNRYTRAKLATCCREQSPPGGIPQMAHCPQA